MPFWRTPVTSPPPSYERLHRKDDAKLRLPAHHSRVRFSRLRQRIPSLNLGFLAPLTPFRHYVIGEAIDAGAVGFSTTILNQHAGFQGRPLACRNASRDEMKAYANAIKERSKGAIKIALTRKIAVMDDEEYKLLDLLLRESDQHVTVLMVMTRGLVGRA
jgi:hypothetical protein